MRKRLFWIIPLAIVVIAAIAFPWYRLTVSAAEVTKTQELKAVSNSFIATYGSKVTVNDLVEPENVKMYVVSWSDDTYVHVSININGVWAEIARQELPKTVTP